MLLQVIFKVIFSTGSDIKEPCDLDFLFSSTFRVINSSPVLLFLFLSIDYGALLEKTTKPLPIHVLQFELSPNIIHQFDY